MDIIKELPKDFYEKRKIGQNDDEICKLIQKDLIEEFIIYVNKNSYPVNSTINSSIYETNKYLLKCEKTSIIEYAAFFGSIQIFRYLQKNRAKLSKYLWFYAIHGNNPEIISILENQQICPINNNYTTCLYESIKCFHNDLANYIQYNYINDNINNDIQIKSIKSYNFEFIDSNILKSFQIFYCLCQYDHCNIVNELVKSINIDVNEIKVF